MAIPIDYALAMIMAVNGIIFSTLKQSRSIGRTDYFFELVNNAIGGRAAFKAEKKPP